MRLFSIYGWARRFSNTQGLLSRRSCSRWAAASVVFACLATATTTYAQVVCDTASPACDCEGCRAFLNECDTHPGHAYPSAEMPPSMPAPVVPSPTEASESEERFGSGVAPDESITAPEVPSTDQLGADVFQPPATPPAGSLASSLGATSGAAGIPSMIGDFFGGGYNYAFIGNGATVATAGGDRRIKFAENNSPFPQNRFYFNFHHFHNAVRAPDGTDRNLDRYSFGLEKLLFGGRASLDVRVPFSNAISTNPEVDSVTDTELGDLSLAVKWLLYRDRSSALSTGLGIILPTGDDFQIGGSFDTIENSFANESVHLQPFIGYYHAPNRRLFTQFFAQMDFDTEGNDVTLGGISDTLQDQTLLFLDFSAGYWVYRNRCVPYFRGLAPMLELHYTTSVEDQEYGAFEGVQSFGTQGGSTLFVENRRRDVLNITGGLYLEVTRFSSLKIGAVAPLRDDSDKLFDSEIGVQFVRRY